MVDENTQFGKISFLKMLEEYSVEIPLIQRDYAQGRASEEKLLQNFLKALKDALQSPIELDFIYGNIRNGKFHPLDGQQRLTTLFLLHWYAAACSSSPEDHAKILHKFSYATRISSRNFCEQIIKNVRSYHLSQEEPQKWIEDQQWFRLAWENDPTVVAMINALNAINKHFKDIKATLWEKLSNKHPISNEYPISFYMVILERLSLSDDLYIKMNARGKPLSPFENLKAQLEAKIEKEEWEKDFKPTETQKKFSHLIDTEWTDLIWNTFAKDNFDQAFMRILSNVAVYTMIKDSKRDADSKRAEDLLNDPTALSVEDVSKEVYVKLYDTLSDMCKLCKLQSTFAELNYFDIFDKQRPKGGAFSIFKCVGESDPTRERRLLYFAVCEYARRNPTMDEDEEKCSQWLRFIRNIVKNSNINSFERFCDAARFIKKMAAKCDDIYSYLSSLPEPYKGFASEGVQREIKKVKLWKQDAGFLELLHDLEDTNFCYGNLCFPFHYMSRSETTELAQQKARLKHLLKQSDEYFKEKLSNETRCALLTNKENSHYYKYWHDHWSDKLKAEIYCFLQDDIQDLRNNISKGRILNAFSEYFDRLEKQTQDDMLDNFDPEDKENWRYKLSKNPSLLNNAETKFLGFSQDGKVYTIRRIKVSNNIFYIGSCPDEDIWKDTQCIF